MKRHKPKARLPRQTTPPTPRSGWKIGPLPAECDQAIAADASAAVVELQFPIPIRGKIQSAIKLRRPMAADTAWFHRQQGNERIRAAEFSRRLAGLTEDEFGELDVSDVVILADACGKLLDEM